nr:MAG TPA: hypothetical protein [Caudoviricetes sp.]
MNSFPNVHIDTSIFIFSIIISILETNLLYHFSIIETY